MNGVDRHRSHLCGWSSNHTDERESQGAGPKAPRTADIQLRDVRPPTYIFFHCEGFSVPFSIAKPTLGGTATPCRCLETHRKSEPLTQPLTQHAAHAATSRSHLTQPPHAATSRSQGPHAASAGSGGGLLEQPPDGTPFWRCKAPAALPLKTSKGRIPSG